MRVRRARGLAGARGARGTVVVIDVLRAFTTAAYAFGSGARALERETALALALSGGLGYAGPRVAMLVVAVMFFLGSLRQTRMDWDVAAPVTGLSTGLFYGVAVLFGAAASLIIARDLWRLLRGRLSDAELIGVVESEEQR